LFHWVEVCRYGGGGKKKKRTLPGKRRQHGDRKRIPLGLEQLLPKANPVGKGWQWKNASSLKKKAKTALHGKKKKMPLERNKKNGREEKRKNCIPRGLGNGARSDSRG